MEYKNILLESWLKLPLELGDIIVEFGQYTKVVEFHEEFRTRLGRGETWLDWLINRHSKKEITHHVGSCRGKSICCTSRGKKRYVIVKPLLGGEPKAFNCGESYPSAFGMEGLSDIPEYETISDGKFYRSPYKRGEISRYSLDLEMFEEKRGDEVESPHELELAIGHFGRKVEIKIVRGEEVLDNYQGAKPAIRLDGRAGHISIYLPDGTHIVEPIPKYDSGEEEHDRGEEEYDRNYEGVDDVEVELNSIKFLVDVYGDTVTIYGENRLTVILLLAEIFTSAGAIIGHDHYEVPDDEMEMAIKSCPTERWE